MGLPVPQDRRNAIVQAAIEDIRNGISTEIIGAKHGVTGACIRQWLITDAFINISGFYPTPNIIPVGNLIR